MAGCSPSGSSNRSATWRDQITIAAIDAFRGYANGLAAALPDAVLVMDHFHTIKLANRAVDQVRRRTNNTVLGHRGRDPRCSTGGERPRADGPTRSCLPGGRPPLQHAADRRDAVIAVALDAVLAEVRALEAAPRIPLLPDPGEIIDTTADLARDPYRDPGARLHPYPLRVPTPIPLLNWTFLERATGIEPAFSAWEADVLPLNYARRVPAGAHTL